MQYVEISSLVKRSEPRRGAVLGGYLLSAGVCGCGRIGLDRYVTSVILEVGAGGWR